MISLRLRDKMPKNPCHHKELKQLNRISGQLDGIKKMIDEGRYCPDILTQLRAVRSSIKTVEANILETHLGHCVHDAFADGSQKKREEKVEEVKELFKRYND